jgi:hypothetical protein
MSKSDEIEFIGHIFEELKFVIKTTNHLTFELFFEDEII